MENNIKKISSSDARAIVFLATGKFSFNNFGQIKPNELIAKINEMKKEEIDIDYLIDFIESFKHKKEKLKHENEAISFIINSLMALKI